MMDTFFRSGGSARRRSDNRALPEGRWLWRRLYVFSVTAGLWSLLRQAVLRTPPDRLPQLAEGLIQLLALILVLYLVAPSAQQLVEMLAALRLRMARGRPS